MIIIGITTAAITGENTTTYISPVPKNLAKPTSALPASFSIPNGNHWSSESWDPVELWVIYSYIRVTSLIIIVF